MHDFSSKTTLPTGPQSHGEVDAPASNSPFSILNSTFVIYDHTGRMVRKDVAFASNPSFSILHSTFVWDGWNIIRETTTEPPAFQLSNLQTFKPSTDYVWGLDIDGTLQGAGGIGGLLAVVRDDGTFLPTYDANGNILEYIDANDGSIVAHYDYSPFGEILIQDGDLAGTFTHRFSTKPYCPITKLVEYQLRKYRPEIGRWLSRDPIEENIRKDSPYCFCMNSAILDSDYLGLLTISGSGNYTWRQPTPIAGMFLNITLKVESSMYESCCNNKMRQMVSLSGSLTASVAIGFKYHNKVRVKNPRGSHCRDSSSGRFIKCPGNGWGVSIGRRIIGTNNGKVMSECETGFELYLAVVGNITLGVPIAVGSDISVFWQLYPKLAPPDSDIKYDPSARGFEASLGIQGGFIAQFDVGSTITIPGL